MHAKKLFFLDTHIEGLAHYFPSKQLFVVGGAVRDIILGFTTEPVDIDLTLYEHPDTIYAALQKASHEAFSLFRTEKFGTVTLIRKADEVTYEITPFREEGDYADGRHPDTVLWSNSLISDAKRRDFTINNLYYTIVAIGDKKQLSDEDKRDISFDDTSNQEDNENFLIALEKKGRMYDEKISLLVVHDNDLIEKFFINGTFQRDVFSTRAEVQNIATGGTIRFLLDPFKGLHDIGKGLLRAVGTPTQRFQEDALRILRGVRLVNTINQRLSHSNIDFERETWASMQKLSGLVSGISKERIHQEIVKVFSLTNPFGWVALIDELGILQILFPALHRNKHDDQPVRYHPFDTYTHILLTLWHLQQINDNYLVKLGMLYHDVGKKDQYEAYAKATTKEEQQEIHSSPANHIVCGPLYVESDFRALGFSNKEIEEIAFYVAHHMRPGQILTARADNQIKRMRQLLSEHGYEKVRSLLDITVADRRGQYNPLQGNEIDSVYGLYDILEDLYRTEGQFTMHDLAVNGDDIMQAFQIEPGPRIKELLTSAFNWVLGDIAQRNTKDLIIAHLRSNDNP